METLNYNENCWKKGCPKVDCRKNKCHCGLKHIVIPADLGDDSKDSPVAPKNGNYCNSIVIYQANKHVYIYSEEGVYTLIDVDAINVAELEEELREALAKVEEIEYSAANCFDTVAALKASVALMDGSFAKTLGYYAKDDNGGAWYKITSLEPAGHYETLSSGLYAELVIEPTMCVAQFGAYGDGTHDDSDSINAALSSGASVIDFVKGKTYNVRGYNDGDLQGSSMEALAGQHGLMVQSNTIVELNESTIKCIPNNRANYNIFSLNGTNNIIIRNGKIIGDVGEHSGATGQWGYGIALKKSENIVLENLYITLCWGDGVNLQKYTANGQLCKNIVMNNVTCYDNRRQGMSVESVDGMEVRNCKFNNTGDTAFSLPGAGVDIEPTANNSAYNIKFFNCEFNNNYGDGFEAMGDSGNIELHDSEIIDNKAFSQAGVLFFNKCPNSGVYNSKIEYSIMDESATWHYKGVPIYLNGRFEIIGCDFINLSLQIRRSTADDKKIVIKDCNFYINTPMSYNRAIEITNAPNTTTVNGCELYVQNCNFENTSNDKSLDISAWISDGGSTNNFSKIIIENNYFYGANRAISVNYLNSCIKNNYMVLSRSFAIQCTEAGKTHIIDGNIIEECSWDYNNAGIIHNDAGINLIFTNNKFFKRATNPQLAIASPSYSPSRWLQNFPITGLDEEHENYIIDNS